MPLSRPAPAALARIRVLGATETYIVPTAAHCVAAAKKITTRLRKDDALTLRQIANLLDDRDLLLDRYNELTAGKGATS